MPVIKDDIHHLATPDGKGKSGIPVSEMFLRFSFIYMIAHGADQFVNIVQQVQKFVQSFLESVQVRKQKEKETQF